MAGDPGDFGVGAGTTIGMWALVSDLLDGEKLPESLNEAIHALCEGRAKIVRVDTPS